MDSTTAIEYLEAALEAVGRANAKAQREYEESKPRMRKRDAFGNTPTMNLQSYIGAGNFIMKDVRIALRNHKLLEDRPLLLDDVVKTCQQTLLHRAAAFTSQSWRSYIQSTSFMGGPGARAGNGRVKGVRQGM